jgi:16S rRNA (uracil1498-N3)-methyltransferase
MNSVILEAHDKISDDLYVINDRERSGHIRNHLKKKIGDELKVTLLGIGLSRAQITSSHDEKIEVKVLLQNYPPVFHPPAHTLLIGAIRPQSLKKVLEYGTCLGVKEFIFFETALCEKSFLDSKVFDDEHLKKHCLLGLEQSALYSSLPKISVCKKPDLNKLPLDRYILSAEGNQNFAEIKQANDLCLAIGPERGFTQKEEEDFIGHGFKRIKIARSILRTELACLAALSQLEIQKL